MEPPFGPQQQGKVSCGSWIRKPDNLHFVVLGMSKQKVKDSHHSSSLEIFSFNSHTASLFSSPMIRHVFEEGEGEPVAVAVHPSGEDIVCSTSIGGCKMFKFHSENANFSLVVKELPFLQMVGPQKCIAFSVDGSKFATGGVDGHLRILEFPSLRIILDEPIAHRSFRDMDFSLDSEFLASTSTDGSARIWKTEDGLALASLTRNLDERIELCRFSKDGTKPFLFCTIRKGDKAVLAVYDVSTWNKIGHKQLLKEHASAMSISLDGKYLALGSKDGDLCVAEVDKMEIYHWSKRMHQGTCISLLEFCPSQRVVLSTSSGCGAVVTRLNAPADWKEWQIYLLLLGLFVASVMAFYILFEKSDSFWNFPDAKNPAVRKFRAIIEDSRTESHEWNAFELTEL